MISRTLILFFALLFSKSISAQKAWVFDDSHSNLQFSVTNLMVAEIEVSMKITEALLKVPGNDFSNAMIDIKADVASIDTDNDGRDEHLRSPDFFDSARYPVLTFKSREFKKIAENKYSATGDLTFHGITKVVTMDVIANTNVRPYDQKNVVGFKANGVIKRTDFDIAADTPSAVLGDEVTIRANVIFVQE